VSSSDRGLREVRGRARARSVAALGVALSALAVLRCGAPEQCVRGSDCDDGWACVSGSCRNVSGVGSDGDSQAARGAADATAAGDAAKAASPDAAVRTTDASDGDGASSERDADTTD
jgi:hypothetical protein